MSEIALPFVVVFSPTDIHRSSTYLAGQTCGQLITTTIREQAKEFETNLAAHEYMVHLNTPSEFYFVTDMPIEDWVTELFVTFGAPLDDLRDVDGIEPLLEQANNHAKLLREALLAGKPKTAEEAAAELKEDIAYIAAQIISIFNQRVDEIVKQKFQ